MNSSQPKTNSTLKRNITMANEKSILLTAGKIALQLGVSGGAVSKVIKTLGIKPDLVKGGCNYYGTDAIKKVKTAIK